MKRALPLLFLLAATACKDGEVEDTGEAPVVTDEDGDGQDALVHGGTDCDDSNAAVYAGAPEVCDGIDNDCDGTTDQGASDALTFYVDSDADGYGLETSTVQACEQPTGHSAVAGDCDDADGSAFPGNDEVCDTVDNNCNGRVDEPGAVDEVTWYTDNDSDGYGDPNYSTASCIQPPGYVDNALDCNDVFAEVSPDATEYCDGIDNNCDGTVDEDTAADSQVFYSDADSDGYGTGDSTAIACAVPSGFAENADDCDDSNSSVNPGGIEVCGDSLDNDCSGDADGGDASDALTKYVDADGDGYGDTSSASTACTFDSGSTWVEVDGDCNDADSSVSPGALELCDGSVDENCDGSVDEDTASDALTWYLDADSDGYGLLSSTSVACSQPTGYVSEGTDCDDGSSAVSPDAAETCENSVDDDCDGVTDECALNGSLSSSDAGAVFSGGAAYDFLGVSSLVVDVDSDGYDDVLLGANYSDEDGANAGSLYLFNGPVSGSHSAGDANVAYGQGASSARFGETVAALDDQDSDGTLDLVIGAPGYDGDYSNGGAIWLSQGPISGSGDLSGDSPLLSASSAGDNLGDALVSGDLDDDGTLDLLVGASGTTYGSVYLFTGPLTASTSTSAADVTYTGNSSGAMAGQAISVGDVDGDGSDDLFYGGSEDDADKGSGSGAGAAYLEYGPLSGGGVASYALYGSSGDGAGAAVNAAGDLNGDGYDDLVVGATGASSSAGAVYVVFGPVTGNVDLSAADLSFTGSSSGDQAGGALAMGDSDGDGSDDLVIGAEYSDSAVSNGGSAYVFYGPFSAGTAALSAADAEVNGSNSAARAGGALGFGDVDGDGYDDLVVGASRETGSYSYAGAALLMMGDQR